MSGKILLDSLSGSRQYLAVMSKPIPTWSQANTDAMIAEVRRLNREMDMYLALRRRERGERLLEIIAWLLFAFAACLAIWNLQ